MTGASKGIGKAICQKLLDQGIHVVGVSRSPSTIQHQHYTHCQADLTCSEDLQRIHQSVLAKEGSLVALVNNASSLDPIAELSEIQIKDWRYLFELNVHSVLALTQLLLPLLRQSKPTGRIINVSSGAAAGQMTGWSAYCASKAAFNMLNECIAREEGPRIVSVAINPGATDTDLQKSIRNTGQGAMDPEAYSTLLDLHRDGKLLKPEQPGNVLAELALRADKDISGKFFKWDAPELSDYQ